MPNDNIKAEKERWLAETEAKTKNRLDRFMTTSSEDIPDLITPADWDDSDYMEKLGFPGEYPYTRGVHSRRKTPTNAINSC